MAQKNPTENDRRLMALEGLADELMSERPRREVVREFMRKAGLPDTTDPIECLNLALASLQGPSRGPAKPANA